MALDKEFFDSINIELVKKKYFNANKVRSLLDTIQAEAEALNAENHRLRSEAYSVSEQKAEISDTLISAQTLARQMAESAKAQAERSIREAGDKAAALVAEAERKAAELNARSERRAANLEAEAKAMAQTINQRQQDYAASCVEACFDMLKKRQEASIEEIKEKWQEFLCGLSSEDGEEEKPSPPPDQWNEDVHVQAQEEVIDDEGFNPIRPAEGDGAASLPDDIEDKVSAIAQELSQINGEED